jgi:hypothetical protein
MGGKEGCSEDGVAPAGEAFGGSKVIASCGGKPNRVPVNGRCPRHLPNPLRIAIPDVNLCVLMTKADVLREHLNYGAWASRRLVDAAGALNPHCFPVQSAKPIPRDSNARAAASGTRLSLTPLPGRSRPTSRSSGMLQGRRAPGDMGQICRGVHHLR